MKKVYRRVLLFTSVVVFLLAAPLVVLYGIGYRAQSLAVDPLPVGVVLVDAEPVRADVYVNDEYRSRVPESIPNLPEGPVTIRVGAEGYETWEKTVVVEPGMAIEVRDIRLFPSDPARNTLLADVERFSLAPNRQLIAAVTSDNRLHVIDQAGTAVAPATRLPRAATSLLWSPNSDQVLIRYGASTYTVATVGRTIDLAAVNQLAGATDVVWDPRIPGRILYRDTVNRLAAFNITGNGSTRLATDVVTFATTSRAIFVLTESGTLNELTLQGTLVTEDVTAPTGTVEQLFVTPAGALAWWMADGSVWVRGETDELELVADTALTIRWSPDGRQLLVQPDQHSLRVYNVSDERTPQAIGTSQLITRLSRAITDPQWFAGGRHLLYQVDDEIIITETDTRDHPRTWQVDTTNVGLTAATVGEGGDTVLYRKNTAQGPVLMQTELVVSD